VNVSASAGPDVDATQPGVQVRVGMKVQVSGTARLERRIANCEITSFNRLQRPAMRTHPQPPLRALGDVAIVIDASLSGEIDGPEWSGPLARISVCVSGRMRKPN